MQHTVGRSSRAGAWVLMGWWGTRLAVGVVVALVAAVLPSLAPLSLPGAPSAASASGTIVTIAGTGAVGFQDGPLGQAMFSDTARGIAVSPAGDQIFVADQGNNRVRLVDRRTGMVSTIAQINSPNAIALGGDGALYVAAGNADAYNPGGQGENGPDKILRIAPGGGISDHATGFYAPSGLAFTSDGTLWVADNHEKQDFPARVGKVVGGARQSVVDLPSIYLGPLGVASAHDKIYVATGYSSYRIDPSSPTSTPYANVSNYFAADRTGDTIFVQNGNRIDTVDTNEPLPGTWQYGIEVDEGLFGGATGLGVSASGDVAFSTNRGRIKMWQRDLGLSGGAVLDSEVAGCSWLAKALAYARGHRGDPVDTKSGNFHLSFEDFAIPGRGPGLTLSRSYNSQFANVDGPFGYGWASSIGTHVEVDGSGNVTVVQGAGCRQTFTRAGSTYSAPPRVVATLEKHDPTSTYRLLDSDRNLWTFDQGTGRLNRIEDPNGNHADFTYTGGKLSSISDTAGRALTITWTGSRITSVSDQAQPVQRTVIYGYSGGNLTNVTDVAGNTWQFGYDGIHQLTTVRDPRQAGQPTPKVLTNTYDAQGRVNVQTDQLNRQTTFDYSSIPDATIVTDPSDNKVLESYRDGVRTSLTRGFGSTTPSTWSFTYDPDTVQISSIIDPNGRESFSATYDYLGNPLTTTDGAGRTTTYTYDLTKNKPLTVADPAGVTTTFTYDSRGNLTKECTPLATPPPVGQTITCTTPAVTKSEVRYEYNDAGHPGDLTTMIDETNRTWSYEYDTYGLRIATLSPAPQSLRTTEIFDNVGRAVSTTAPKGYVSGGSGLYTTTYETNAYGDITKATDPLGKFALRTYDALRQVQAETDPNGDVTTYLYDDANQLYQVNRPGGTNLKNEYYPDGALKAQIDGGNKRTDYTYDSQGRLESVDDPVNQPTTYRYDPAGNLRTRQDPGGNCALSTGCTTYQYNGADQLASVNYSDAGTPDVASTVYDSVGRRATQTMSDGRVYGWLWDSLGRLTRTTDPDGTYVGYEWSLRDELTRIRYPQGSYVDRTYDESGRWTAVTDWSGKTTSFGYDANSNNTSITFPTGTTNVDEFGFDRADRMLTATWKKGGVTTGAETYTRSNSGQLTSITSAGGPTINYGYDSLGRLTTFAGLLTYGYDNADNLTKLLDNTRLVPDPANQLCFAAPAGTTDACTTPNTNGPAGSTNYGTDSRGNRTSVTSPTGRASSMTYDQDNRLTSVNQGADGEYTAIPQYTYVNTAAGTGTCTPAPCTQLAAGATITAKVTGGWYGVPETGIRAVTLNVTASGSTAGGYATLYPSDMASEPGTSNLNFATGETVSNAVVAKVGPGGTVKIKNGSAGTLQIRIEATGWFKDPAAFEGGATFEPVNPTRLMWTAQGGTNCNPSPCALVAGNSSIAVDVTGPNPVNSPVPATGVSAVAVNITAITTAAAGSLKVYPNGAGEPAQSSLYWTAGETHAAMVIVPVDANGNIRLKNMSTGTTHLIVDVQGYFTPAPDASPNVLQTVDPTRIVNTTTGTSTGTCTPNCNRFTAGSQKTIQITGGVVPTGATAASITITAVNGSVGGWLEAAPQGSFVQGAASVVNYGAGENVANSAIIKLPANGKIVVYSSQAVDVIIDVTGYFSAPTSTYTYTYDGDGLRRTKNWYGIGATYRYSLAEDLPMPIEENVFGGYLRTYYIYGPGGLPIEQITELLGSGVTSKVWFHHDQLGSTRLLTDENGDWRTKYSFDPYGNTAAVETNSAYATVTTPLQYAGQFTDAETGYQYLRNRFYDPATGRFITKDPLNHVTRQAYAYAANSPLSTSDSSGLCRGHGIGGAIYGIVNIDWNGCAPKSDEEKLRERAMTASSQLYKLNAKLMEQMLSEDDKAYARGAGKAAPIVFAVIDCLDTGGDAQHCSEQMVYGLANVALGPAHGYVFKTIGHLLDFVQKTLGPDSVLGRALSEGETGLGFMNCGRLT